MLYLYSKSYSMQIKKLQEEVNRVFTKCFGYTPFTERMEDIDNEYQELRRWSSLKNLREETGDLLNSIFQLHTENDWSVLETMQMSLNKTESRYLQYKSLGRKTKVCILGGNFSPIHNGHIQLAQFILKATRKFDEVWLLPAYGHMQKDQEVTAQNRLDMCNIAASVDARIKVFDFEIKNQLAGETFNFVKRLMMEEKLNDIYNFSLSIGIDNANKFETWVNYEELERIAKFVVVPRKGVERDINVDWYLKEPHIYIHGETDIMDMSSTYVRNKFHDYYKTSDESIIEELNKVINPDVVKYIIDNNLYG